MRFFYKMKKGKLTVLGLKPRVSELPCKARVGPEGMQSIPFWWGMFHFNWEVDEEAFVQGRKYFKRRKNPAIYLLGRRNGTLDPSLYGFLAHLIFTLWLLLRTCVVPALWLWDSRSSFLANFIFCFVCESITFSTSGFLFQWCVLTADVTSVTPAKLLYRESMSEPTVITGGDGRTETPQSVTSFRKMRTLDAECRTVRIRKASSGFSTESLKSFFFLI